MSINEPPIASTNSVAPPAAPGPGAGDIIGRIIFGGFWSVVTLGALIFGFVGFSHGQVGPGFGALLVAALTGMYARYIFRGGRFRILFW
jgi:hypothetical protein